MQGRQSPILRHRALHPTPSTLATIWSLDLPREKIAVPETGKAQRRCLRALDDLKCAPERGRGRGRGSPGETRNRYSRRYVVHPHFHSGGSPKSCSRRRGFPSRSMKPLIIKTLEDGPVTVDLGTSLDQECKKRIIHLSRSVLREASATHPARIDTREVI